MTGKYNDIVYILICFAQGGIYVFNLFDSMSAGLSLLFIVMAELIAVAWLFGTLISFNTIES